VPKVRLLAVWTVVLLAAGCSSGPASPTPSPEPTPSVAASSTPASAGPCPDGAYTITSFEGRGETASAGKGTGGNITADFTSGTFTIASDGSDPVTLDLGPSNAELRFNGEIKGEYRGDPAALRLSTTGAHGDVSIKGFGFTRNFSVGGLANQLIGKSATAQVTCDAAGTTVVILPNASLTLTRR
jgi:hypothetical protein